MDEDLSPPTRPRALISSSIRWGYLWQRHQAFAVAAAEAGWQVDFLQPRPRNLTQVATYPWRRVSNGSGDTHESAPPPGVRVVGLNGWRESGNAYDLALVYLPDRLTEWFLRRNPARRIVYDAVLDWETVPRSWYPPLGWRSAERRIATRPNAAVTSDSPSLLKRFEAYGADVRVVPPAADRAFLDFDWSPYLAKDVSAAYFGSVRDEIDVDVLLGLSAANVPVHVIGSIVNPDAESALRRAGAEITPEVSIEQLPSFVNKHRFLLLPYQGPRASTLAPAKLWNCLASNSWVLSSGLGGLPEVPTLRSIARDAYVETITGLRDTEPPSPQIGSVPTWENRWQEIVDHGGVRL